MKHLKIAATADGGFVIEGYGVPFGGPIKGRDLHGQFFSKKTDFALDLIPDGQRPLLFQHGLDSSVDTAVIGRWGVKRIDDGGVWVQAQLDARSEYINEIKELVDSNALGFSSGTMGHLVKVAPKTGEILKWALVELSLTPNPANPNAYIVRANKSAAAHVKSLFATKHGDHDQSEHGNWASGGGSNAGSGDEKEKSKPGFYGSDHWDKPGMPKTVAVSEMSRDKYDRAILPMPDSYPSGRNGANGRSAWTAVTTADSNGWLDENDDVTKLTSGLDIPYIPAESITSPEAWTFALGFANGTLDLAPSDDNKGNVIEPMSLSRDKEDFITLSDRLTDVNAHSSAATFDSLIATWDDFGPGASKKSLKVKRSTKHGDHDQSEHGNWATGGGSDKEDKGARDTNRTEENRRSDPRWLEKFGDKGRFDGGPRSEKAGNNLINFMEKVGAETNQLGLVTQSEAMKDRFEKVQQLVKEGNGKQAQTVAADIRDRGAMYLRQAEVAEKHGDITDDAGVSRSSEQLTQLGNAWVLLGGHAYDIANPSGGESSDGPDDKFNDWMSGYDVPGMPKTLRVRRSTKHGDHDQSEHGNWANGTNAVADSRRETSNRYWNEAKEDADKLAAAIANRGSWNDETNKVLKESMRLIKQGLGDGDYRTVLEAVKEALDLDQIRSAYNNPRSTAVNGFLNNVYAATDNAYLFARLADQEISKKP